MKKMVVTFLILLFIAPWFSSASALYTADITYDYQQSDENYTFTFTVHNTSTDSSDGPLDFFIIYFDADDISLYSNLVWTQDNDWYVEAYEYDPSFGGFPAISFADDSFLGSGGGGIDQGDSLGGFSVNFDYSGGLNPDEQIFSWYVNFGTSDTDNGGIDMYGYWILGEDSGTIRYVSSEPPLPIPEPSTFLLFASLICGIFIRKKDYRDCPSIPIS